MVTKFGELESVKAAVELNQIYCLSASSTFSLEEVAEAAGPKGKLIFEIDLRLPEMVVHDLLKRIANYECFKAVVINAQYLSLRKSEIEWKHDFIIPKHLKAGSLLKYKDMYGNGEDLMDCYGILGNFEKRNGISLELIPSFRKMLIHERRSDMKIVVKGIMCKEDAFGAAQAGADAIWVSSGSNLKSEGQPSAIAALKAITSYVKGRYSHV